MSRRRLEGCKAIVTGASSGIGRALALELGRHGARVLVTARREAQLTELADAISSAGGEAHALSGDIAEADFRRRLLDQAASRLGGLDLLVNNAGLGAWGYFADADEARMRRLMEVNFFAPVELIRLALPLLRQGRSPMIVNVGSVLGHRGAPSKTEYCASKFALHGFSDALRAELAHEGMDVLLVSPSTTATEFFEHAINRPDRPPLARRKWAMSSEAVARKTVRAIRAGRHEIILSAGGKLLVWFDRLFPTLADIAVARFGRKG